MRNNIVRDHEIKTPAAVKDSVLTRQHLAIHGHMKFTTSAVGKLDLQSMPGIATSNALKERIALYRWSLLDLKEAVQRDFELNRQVFSAGPSLKAIARENRDILGKIIEAISIAEQIADSRILREELNVILVKVNLAVNAICEAVKLHLIKEEVLAKSVKR